MGNYLNMPGSDSRDMKSLKAFKKIQLDDVFKVFTDYYENGIYPRTSLNLEEFDDMFAPIITTPPICYKKLE